MTTWITLNGKRRMKIDIHCQRDGSPLARCQDPETATCTFKPQSDIDMFILIMHSRRELLCTACVAALETEIH